MKVSRIEGASINVATYTDEDGTVTSRDLVMTIHAQVPTIGPGGQPVVAIIELEQFVLPMGKNDKNGRLLSDDVATLLRGEEIPPDVMVAPAALLDHLGRNGQPRP